MIAPSRRGFIAGLTALIVAPTIVRASSLMPVKVMEAHSSASLWLVQWGEHTVQSTFRRDAKVVWDSRRDLAPGVNDDDLSVIEMANHALLCQPTLSGLRFHGTPQAIQKFDQEINDLCRFPLVGGVDFLEPVRMFRGIPLEIKR